MFILPVVKDPLSLYTGFTVVTPIYYHIIWFQKLNPSVEAPLGKLLQHIREHVESQKKGVTYEVRRKDGEDAMVVFTINTKLAGLPYTWVFRAQPADKTMVRGLELEWLW